MTPDTLELLLVGADWWPHPEPQHKSPKPVRQQCGLLWQPVHGTPWDLKWKGWRLDLTDDATGGVLLGMLGEWFGRSLISGGVEVNDKRGDHLGEVCARALLASADYAATPDSPRQGRT